MNRGHPVGAAAALLVLLTVGEPSFAETHFEPSLGLGVIYIDNLGLAPPDQPQESDFSAQVTPRIFASREGPRFTGVLDYSQHLLYFRNHPQANSHYGSGNANGLWTVAPNALFLEGRLSNGQQVIDPNAPRNVDNLFDVRNVSTELSSRLAPYFKRDFGTVTALLRYSWSWDRYGNQSTDAQNTALQDSNTRQVTARLATTDQGRRVVWSAGGQSLHSTFAEAPEFRADRASADMGVRLVHGLRMLATVGAETDLRKGYGQGGLDSGSWLAGFSYAPSEASSVMVKAGRRYFGNSYVFDAKRDGRVVKLDASYSEDPTTDGVFGSLVDVVPGELEVPEVTAVTSVLRNTFEPYLRKQFSARMRLVGARTEVALTGYSVRREYLTAPDAGRRDLSRAAQFSVARTMSPRDNLRLSALYDSVSLRDGPSNHGYLDSLAYSHILSPTLVLDASVNHVDRGGSLHYRANFGGITIRKVFR